MSNIKIRCNISSAITGIKYRTPGLIDMLRKPSLCIIKMRLKNIHIITALSLNVLLCACTFTTTIIKQPVLNVSTDSLAKQLNRLVVCESFNLNGTSITTNGKKEDVLEIDVIKGKNIPADDDAMMNLGKQIALQVKECMTDKNEYSSYKVLFVTQSTKGIVTETRSRGKVFTNEELKIIPAPVKAA